jgi:cation diffusion facilitator family transporter
MSAHCSHHDTPTPENSAHLPRYRRILWAALVLNAVMFVAELIAGYKSGSLSLLADAIDFGGDAVNYGVSLVVLSATLAWRTRAAILKAISMMGFGLYVLGSAVWHALYGALPDALSMGVVGTLALVVNMAVAWMLYAYREGDANMRSVWLCSRNDAIGNLAVMGAALSVLGTHTAWPDLAVAAVMASLALHGGWQVLRQAREELHDEAHSHNPNPIHR